MPSQTSTPKKAVSPMPQTLMPPQGPMISQTPMISVMPAFDQVHLMPSDPTLATLPQAPESAAHLGFGLPTALIGFPPAQSLVD